MKEERKISSRLPHGAVSKIAKMLGLSYTTVHFCLQGNERYSEETKSQVYKAALDIIEADEKEKRQLKKELKQLIKAA